MGKRHRILLSLNDELHSILKDYSKETGMPAAAFVVELLELSKPGIAATITAIKQTKMDLRTMLKKKIPLCRAEGDTRSKGDSAVQHRA